MFLASWLSWCQTSFRNDQSVNPLDQTVIEQANRTMTAEVAQPSPNPVQLPSKPKEVKININDIKNIDIEYYKQLEAIYEMYCDKENVRIKPRLSDMRKPRIFRDKRKNIVAYESLEEYIDNNHPVWSDYRKIFHQYLYSQKSDRDLADYVHQQWDSGLVIDLTQNLSCFPRKKFKRLTDKSQSVDTLQTPCGQSGSTGAHSQSSMNDKREKLVAMYKRSVNSDHIKRREAARYSWYRSYLARIRWGRALHDPVEVVGSDSLRKECGFCYNVCLCLGRSLVATGSKRKREEDDQDPVPVMKRPRRMDLEDLMQVVVRTYPRDSQRCANIMKSAEEAMDLNACYVSKIGFSSELTKELLSLERVYDGFKKYYKSPYARDNPPVKPKDDESISSYTEFLEDY